MKSDLIRKPLPHLALLAAHLIWGANFVVAKIALQEIPPMSLGFLRFGLACLLILPFLTTLEGKEKKIKFEDVPTLFIATFLVTTFNIALFYYGLERTTAINASTLSLVVPVLSVLVGWWFLREKIYWINFLGITISVFGSAVIIGLPLFLTGSLSGSHFIGDMLIIISGISFVIGSLLLKKMLKKYHPLIITALSFLVGAITFAAPAVIEYLQNPQWLQGVSILGLLGLFYITILSSVVAYFFSIWGLQKIELSQVNLFQYIEPAIAATFAVLILNERISFSFIIGTCLIVLGVYWGTLGKQEHHHAGHKHHRI